MKKIAITIILSLFLFFSNAQETKIGVKAGLNVANFSGKIENNDVLLGYHAGLVLEFKVADIIAIQPELLFSTQGSKIEHNTTTTTSGITSVINGKKEIHLSYIHIPIMGRIYPTENLSIEAGPQLGYLLAAKQDQTLTTTTSGISNTIANNIDTKDSFKNVDYAINIGLGYDFTENIEANLRYSIGVANINDIPNEKEIKNAVFQFSIAVKF